MAGDAFEGKSLDALYAMVAAAKPTELTTSADALLAAVPEINSIATDLDLYIKKVEWHGTGGDAFRAWGRGMVTQTEVLGDFTSVVGECMQRAGGALSDAQKAIPKPAGVCFADPDKEKARIEAETGPKLQEAINQMNRLVSFYDAERERIAAEPEPVFEPIPKHPIYNNGERAYQDGGAVGGGSSVGGAGVRSAGVDSVTATAGGGTVTATAGGGTVTAIAGDGTVTETGGAVAASAPNRPDTITSSQQPVGTNIDSVAVAPPPEATARPGGPGPSVPSPTSGSTPPLVVPGQGIIGPGRPGTPGGTPTPVAYGGPSGPGVARPGGPGAMPRVGTPDGIVGGRPTPVGGTAGGRPKLPMGTVVGEEHGAYGRGAMGAGAGHMPGAMGQGAGMSAGRRLAYQPGGTVGSVRASGSARGEFTPGGTGLLRPGTAAHSPDREQAARRRPDYLAEDEETWTADQRTIVPPVID
ncbi:hypothetical protein GCM10020367_47740 [Streptomyces sannanensis]|uniref:WXG100 family type VII secretion target n=1 Tax=Streptomyces sannanensis TaxID=285536 RepID=A0ABP6SHI6_9ACTN